MLRGVLEVLEIYGKTTNTSPNKVLGCGSGCSLLTFHACILSFLVIQLQTYQAMLTSTETFTFYIVPNVSFSLECDTLRVISYGLEWSETLLLSKSGIQPQSYYSPPLNLNLFGEVLLEVRQFFFKIPNNL